MKFPVSPLENAEKLEQLRALENGIQIAVVKVDYDSVGVDMPEDVAKVEAILIETIRHDEQKRFTQIRISLNVLFCEKNLFATSSSAVKKKVFEMKFIFVTGGVVSSLGKGLTAAALGTLLENRGLKVALQKFDPYLNVDPGTMSPYQHGEVYVLDDGAETDLDLGHYERFTNVKLTRMNNLTSGQVYQTVLNNEREGKYLGKTVQVIPHVTDEIKNRIHALAEKSKADVIITEIGGTTGDIEGLPFLEAIREFALEVGYNNAIFLHVTYVPFIKAAGELKTKPTQQSVAKLREIGIMPHIIVCRCEKPLDKELRQKISMFCNVPLEAVIEEKDVDHSIYEVPLMLQRERVDDLVCRLLDLHHARAEHGALAGNHPQAHRAATSRARRRRRQIHRLAGRV